MFVAAARALSRFAPVLEDATAPLYPALEGVRDISTSVAFAVGLEAQKAGLAEQTTPEKLEDRIKQKMWSPNYVRYKRVVV
jgi:malate dehydrogenase (oxaloacetate-decarboxylating)